jgi:hypothetical protein
VLFNPDPPITEWSSGLVTFGLVIIAVGVCIFPLLRNDTGEPILKFRQGGYTVNWKSEEEGEEEEEDSGD